MAMLAGVLARSETPWPAGIGEPRSGSSQILCRTAPAGVEVGAKTAGFGVFLLQELLLGQQFMPGAVLGATPTAGRIFIGGFNPSSY